MTASTPEELENCMLELVRSHKESGTIYVSGSWSGDLTSDVNEAAYHVWKNDPLGSYAIEYITASATQLLSRYEVQVSITYRRSAREISSITAAYGTSGTTAAIETAVDNLDSVLVLHVTGYQESLNCEALVDSYCSSHLESVMEKPSVSVSVYPDSGSTRIIELRFSYEHSAAELRSMQEAVSDAIASAANYVRFRADPQEKAEVLYTWLKERFDYTEGNTSTPVWSLLCEGIYNDQTLSEVYTMICNETGIPCVTVSGYSDGSPYYWNIITFDGYSRHADLSVDMQSDSETLSLYLDSDLPNYSWDREVYPVCTAIPENSISENENSTDNDTDSDTSDNPEESSESTENTDPPVTADE